MPDALIPIFIGYDYRERAATNVLIDSLYQNSSAPLSITPLVNSQLIKKKYYFRNRDPKQSTDFSFTRFLVPFLMDFNGWAIFMDCDMLCRNDITKLWNQRDDSKALMCVKHDHIPLENKKFLGEEQTKYQKKNWSSLMMFNCSRCKNLTVDYVNKATGLQLHQFHWLENDSEIGNIEEGLWNYLVDVQEPINFSGKEEDPSLLHWTLGGPWFKGFETASGSFAVEWFRAREESVKLTH